MKEDPHLNQLRNWTTQNLEIAQQRTIMLSGPNSLYESYKTFMEELDLIPLGLKPFFTLFMLHVALNYNCLLIKMRTAKGTKIVGCGLHVNRNSNPSQDGPIKPLMVKTEIEYAAR